MIVEGFDFDTWKTGLIASCANYQLSKFGQLRIPRQSRAFTAEGVGSILGQGTKIPQAMWCGQNNNKNGVININQTSLSFLI